MIILKIKVSNSHYSKESRNAEKLHGSSCWFLCQTTIVLMRGGSSDEFCRCQACLGKYTLLGDEENNPRLAMYERRLPFFGCGIGWCCFLSGFLCPLIWYIAALLYCCKYYNRDPRERPGLAASAVLRWSFLSYDSSDSACAGNYLYSSDYYYPFCFTGNVYTETILELLWQLTEKYS